MTTLSRRRLDSRLSVNGSQGSRYNDGLFSRSRFFMSMMRIVVLAAVAASLYSCRQKPPPEPGVATPSVTLKRDRAPLGSPIEVTYRFDVAANAPPFKEDYKVFVGFVDSDQ